MKDLSFSDSVLSEDSQLESSDCDSEGESGKAENMDSSDTDILASLHSKINILFKKFQDDALGVVEHALN
jgi:hypothetical protein